VIVDGGGEVVGCWILVAGLQMMIQVSSRGSLVYDFKEASEAAFRALLYHPEGSGRERSKWHFQDAIKCE
jgi:hypothetical protein